uniref:Uncharacterized protein n=1 Tax=Steinernema glaseri TaxID=37863 RepID=A0A1I7ZXH9_9BILA
MAIGGPCDLQLTYRQPFAGLHSSTANLERSQRNLEGSLVILERSLAIEHMLSRLVHSQEELRQTMLALVHRRDVPVATLTKGVDLLADDPAPLAKNVEVEEHEIESTELPTTHHASALVKRDEEEDISSVSSEDEMDVDDLMDAEPFTGDDFHNAEKANRRCNAPCSSWRWRRRSAARRSIGGPIVTHNWPTDNPQTDEVYRCFPGRLSADDSGRLHSPATNPQATFPRRKSSAGIGWHGSSGRDPRVAPHFPLGESGQDTRRGAIGGAGTHGVAELLDDDSESESTAALHKARDRLAERTLDRAGNPQNDNAVIVAREMAAELLREVWALQEEEKARTART